MSEYIGFFDPDEAPVVIERLRGEYEAAWAALAEARAEVERLRDVIVGCHSNYNRLEEACVRTEHEVGQARAALADVREHNARLLARLAADEQADTTAACRKTLEEAAGRVETGNPPERDLIHAQPVSLPWCNGWLQGRNAAADVLRDMAREEGEG